MIDTCAKAIAIRVILTVHLRYFVFILSFLCVVRVVILVLLPHMLLL